MQRHDIVVVGGGILGLATAYRLLQQRPGLSLLLLEKESLLGEHQTGHNSGVLHAGLYYKPGSLKAKLSVEGLKKMVSFCREHGVAHEICGKIVVATSQEELPRLEQLFERGTANGLRGLRRLTRDQLQEIEPHAGGIAALHVPEEGIVDYPGVVTALKNAIERSGGAIACSTPVKALKREVGGWRIITTEGDFFSKQIIACAGLHSDRIARASGMRSDAQIIPFRGEYYKILKERSDLVRHLIYPVPDPRFPFLGVHFTRMIRGGVEAGPNAVLALSREGYAWNRINLRDLAGTLGYPGLWKFLFKYPSLCSYEIYRSLSKDAFCKSLQKLVPEIKESDLEKGPSGVRAQAMNSSGSLLEDFCFTQGEGILHIINAPSPAATASLAIAEAIIQQLEPKF